MLAQDFLGAPGISLSVSPYNAPSGCNPQETQATYTCNAWVKVTWNFPTFNCPDDGTCTVQYCLTESPTTGSNGLLTGCAGIWGPRQSPFMLTAPGGGTAPNGEYSVYAEFRTVTNGTTIKYSSPSPAATITLNSSGPMPNLNSPAGILAPVEPSPTLAQSQYVNSDLPQWITYSGWSTDNPTEPVTFSISGCASSCPPISGANNLSAFLWEWPGSQPPPSYGYLQLTDTDEAGNQASTWAPTGYSTSLPAIIPYSATIAPQEVDCQPSGGTQGNTPVACTTLADDSQLYYEIPGDPTSLQVNQYIACDGSGAIAFSGYADPSMRRDPVATTANLYGTNLWMLYSYPLYWATYTTHDQCPPPVGHGDLYHTPAVETHVAESATIGSSPLPGGTSWQAYCASGSCTTGTPVWPSEPFCSGTIYQVSQGQSA